MWMVGSKSTMKVECKPERNFPIAIELRFGGKENSGMWFDVSDAWYLVRELLKAIAKQYAAQHSVHPTSGEATIKVDLSTLKVDRS